MAKKKSKKTSNSGSVNKKHTGYIRAMWLLAIAGFFAGLAIMILVSSSKMPDTEELENPSYEYSTIVYAEDKKELGRYFTVNRDWVRYDQLSPHLVDALIATEDERFHEHNGIDFRGTMRAVAFAGTKGGASTITQQLAKLFFTRKSSNFFKRVWQKLQEWAIAIEFEKRYTKEEIIAMYLNKYDFLNDSNGVSAAAKTYFDKDQKDLNVQEAAILVGMLKNPRIYNPRLYEENAMKRREVVLSQMKRNGVLTQAEYDSIRVLPLDISSFSRSSHDKGLAPYFRAELKKKLKDIFNDPKYAKPGGGKYNVDEDGLKVYTTINLDMQRHAEKAMTEHMGQLQERYFQVWDKKDPWSYEATKNQRTARVDDLRKMIERSDRYKRLRKKYLTDITNTISANIPNVRLWNGDLNRMFDEERNPGELSRLLRIDFISKKQKATYEEIMASEYYPDLKARWNTFRKATESAFSKKVPMTVFAHNAAGEKTMTMSPMDSIRYHKKHMHLGSIAVDPMSGAVKTWVGGIGFKYFKYDHVTSDRQVGSTFKPFIYTSAIMKGHSPCIKIRDEKYSILKNDPDFSVSEDWAPENYDGIYSGQEFTMYECLQKSLNSASIWLLKDIGSVEPVINLAGRMGIPKKKIPPYPSICLGTPALSVWEMTSSYTTFPNNGIHTEPYFIQRIEDKDGKLIYSAQPIQRRALNESDNYVMRDMLQRAASSQQGKVQSRIGGKTGTTDDYVDGWFMGFTPKLVVGTWVGGEEQYIRFLSIGDGAGSKMARPYFIDFMRRIENDPNIRLDKTAVFDYPEKGLDTEIDCSVYEDLYYKEPVKKVEDEFDDEFGDEEFGEEIIHEEGEIQ